jgi:hypothetical protein
MDPPGPDSLVPATVLYSTDYLLCLSHSSECISDQEVQPATTLWNPANIPPTFYDTPTFYQCLIGDAIPTTDQCDLLSQVLQDKSLYACSDGAHCPSIGAGSHGWVFHYTLGGPIVQDTGPSDSHPLLTSSCHSELGGILAALYIIC